MVDYMDYLEKQRNQISLMSVVIRLHGDELEKKMPELVERMALNCNRTFGELERVYLKNLKITEGTQWVMLPELLQPHSEEKP